MQKILNLWTYTTENDNYFKYSFITLTFSGKTEPKKINEKLKTWITKTRRLYRNYNYTWKLELHKSGEPHLHIMTDTHMDWKVVRGIWNKTQHKEVDQYQNKQKTKYKNGYFYDEKMIENNKVVAEETQIKRYLQGKKANWRNPNSTDTKNLTENDNVNSYISKYINKSNTEEEEQQQLKIKQFWGCNDELKQLKYATFKETELTIATELQLIDNQTKTIYNEKNQVKIIIANKINNEELNQIEKKQLQKNRQLLKTTTEKNYKKVQKKIQQYDALFKIID